MFMEHGDYTRGHRTPAAFGAAIPDPAGVALMEVCARA